MIRYVLSLPAGTRVTPEIARHLQAQLDEAAADPRPVDLVLGVPGATLVRMGPDRGISPARIRAARARAR